MTVEQSPLERFPNQKPQHQTPLLNIDKDAPLSPSSGVIDLTNDPSDKEDDLNKALALSLKEHERGLGGQVSMEDQDISRVIEASLAESKAVGTKRKRGEVWQDPLNPNDRKRNGDWPVGLKNVGNTCWFSSVIQSLFHLPIFRRLVLEYISPRDRNIYASSAKEKRNLSFMQELRKLFALMLCSKRKYVDPSQALEELKEAFPDSSGTDSQQDVSEFSHKLLEWLEEAFKLNSSYTYIVNKSDKFKENNQESCRNPMLDLFYGHFRCEGRNEGRIFSNEETFGQYPLQVNNFVDIHESLEAAMSLEIESYDVMSKSGQEVKKMSWFTRLPPVLLFELSRFQFNQQLGRPEKIHNKLEFPEIMYMDRYMEQNKNTTRLLREKVRRLKDAKDKLQKHLEKFLNYGSGPKKMPLNDLLQSTLEFVENKKHAEEHHGMTTNEDVEMASPASVSSMGGDSPSNSPNKIHEMEIASSHSGFYFSPSSSLANFDKSNETTDTVPMPQHISEVELKVFQTCLKRWKNEVETNVKSLQDEIKSIDNTIDEIYSDPSLTQKPYRLHAVLVHEGQAASGHYWAYVYSPSRKLWLKFNDVTVTDASWSELQKESMGGHNYASAYCLVYVDKQRSDLFEETKEMEMISPENLTGLSEDLQQYVYYDNNAFQMELEQWEIEQSKKKDSLIGTNSDIECNVVAEKKPSLEEGSCFLNQLTMEHAMLHHRTTISRVETFSKLLSSYSQKDAFKELVCQEVSRIRRLARLALTPHEDYRLQHIGVYIVLNSNCPDIYLKWSILEQFLIPELDEIPNGRLIKEMALQNLEELQRTVKSEHIQNYVEWHQEYQKFRKVVSLFLSGVESYHNESYTHALTFLLPCCYFNTLLIKAPGEKRDLDNKLLFHYRRQCIYKLNELLANHFEYGETHIALDALNTAYEYVLPCMHFLASPQALSSDNDIAEMIRNRWCSLLGTNLANNQNTKQEKLQDFLGKLLDPTNEMPKPRTVPQARFTNLEGRFREITNVIINSGEYEAAQQT